MKKGYKYYPMHMHLHTCHQPGASMEGHIYNAALLGMSYIRFTDHDTRTGRKKDPVDSFDFSKGCLSYEDAPGCEVGWKVKGEPTLNVKEGEITVLGKDSEPCGIELYSSGTRHTVSLIADVTLTLGLKLNLNEGGRAILDFRLSQRPPLHKPAHFRLVFGNPTEVPTENTAERKIEVREDGIYTVRLSELVAPIAEIGGLDNVFDTVTLLVEGKGASATVSRLEIEAKYGFDEVIKRQRVIADEIGMRYGVKPFVTTEISGAGNHKNCFSTRVPVIDYAARGYNVTQKEAIKHVTDHGGIFAYNHPFERYKRQYKLGATKEELKKLAEDLTCELKESKVYGATLMEVAFIEGRCGFSLQDHLALWDKISLSGIFITGYGDSDSHYSDKKWFDGTNFASYVAAAEELPFPIDEDEFIESMKAGRLYTADPVRYKGKVSFTSCGREMGSVIVSDTPTVCHLALSDLADCTVKISTNGEYTKTLLPSDGELSVDLELPCNLAVNLTRVEIYNENGRCIMLTNPIYLVNPNLFKGEIPKERLT